MKLVNHEQHADANNKKQALLADNNYDDIYFESCEVLSEENAVLTLMQANLIPYVYWWPHCLACCAWILGVCPCLILLYSIKFGAGSSYHVIEGAREAVQTDHLDDACDWDYIVSNFKKRKHLFKWKTHKQVLS